MKYCQRLGYKEIRFKFRRTKGYHINTSQWRYNGRDGVSNLQPHNCLLNRYWGADQIKDQSSASLAFVRGIHRWPLSSPHKGPVTRKMFPFDDVKMIMQNCSQALNSYDERHKGVITSLLVMLWWDCVQNVSFFDYLLCFLCNTWSCMHLTDPSRHMWPRGYIWNSSYHHDKMGYINLSHCCYHHYSHLSEGIVFIKCLPGIFGRGWV